MGHLTEKDEVKIFSASKNVPAARKDGHPRQRDKVKAFSAW